ncbi:hypothetical protein CR513_29500, partial [Mucuna pruriens]
MKAIAPYIAKTTKKELNNRVRQSLALMVTMIIRACSWKIFLHQKNFGWLDKRTKSRYNIDMHKKSKLEALQLKDIKAKNYLFQAIDHQILKTIISKDNSKQIWEFENEVPRFSQSKEATTSIT